MSLAYYLILESDSPMYRFSKWAQNHKHPFVADIPSQRISEIFSSVGEESKMNFFNSQANCRSEKEYVAYDTTSISSYSELIDHVKYGKNKDGESLPQVNLALVFGQTSMLPVYFRKLPGNITDVMTIRKLLRDMKYLNINKV
jgi:transposase